MDNIEKLCVFCKHLQYNSQEYGEYAEPANLECSKGHSLCKGIELNFIYDVADFRRMILTAKNCNDYELA